MIALAYVWQSGHFCIILIFWVIDSINTQKKDGNHMDKNQKGRKYLEQFENYLYEREKHWQTIEKYLRDVRHFLNFAGEKEGISKKEQILQYKEYLIRHYKPASVNSMLTALNKYLEFIKRGDCKVQLLRVQKQMFREEEKELSMEEYRRLVRQAQSDGNLRLECILQTIGSTGIRIGELKYITAEALKKKAITINFKGKSRCIILPHSLIAMLKEYCREKGIESGSIFVTRSGRPVDRRNIWAEMKKLCRKAGVAESKGFPHNLRHLFACSYYEKEKDIIRLADYLGHSNVETTRRYTMTSSIEACRNQLELGMLVGRVSGGEEIYPHL